MSDSRDPRTRNVDPFDAPSDYGDPWRGRALPILLAGFGVIALVVVLFLLLRVEPASFGRLAARG
jgi:hypothetical protein